MLHELGHGLGFVGYGNVDGGDNACDTHTPGDGCIGPPPVAPSSYDRFTEDGAGNPLLGYANPSVQLGQALSGQAAGVFFDGPEATAANGDPVRLYAPNPWNDSSYSHLDEEPFNSTPNSLVTPSQSDGESEHHPGPVGLGMFRDMGWAAVNTAPTLSGLPDQLVAVDGVADDALDLWALASDGQSPASALTYSIVGEDYEGSFPGSGWQVVDENPAGGLYYWGRRGCRSRGGSFSAWSVGAGDTTLSCYSHYPGEVFAWMVYGPFSLADATAAELVFDWWSDTAAVSAEFFGVGIKKG